MNAERALVSKVAQMGKGAADLAAEGLEDDHFIYEDTLAVWKFILGHQQRYGKQPSVPTIMEEFPTFNFELSEEPLDYIKDRFLEALERRHAIEFAKELAIASNDPTRAGELAEMVLERGRTMTNLLPGGKLVRFAADAEQHIATYKERAASGKEYIGIPLGIKEIDDATLGIQPHELISVVGWQGTGKSTLVQWFFWNFFQQGRRCLFISLEMSAEALIRKWLQMEQKFQTYKHLKMGNLTDAELAQWEEWVPKAKAEAHFREIMIRADGGKWTPERVHGEIIRHRPDVVAIDYITLMDTSSKTTQQRWERLTQLSQELKNIAQAEMVPIFSIAQTNRSSAKDGAELDNIAGTFALGAASDIVIGLHQSDEMKQWNMMEVRLNKNRDGEQIETNIYWDMERMRFADNILLEQVRKAKEEHDLKVAEQPGGKKAKMAYRLGQAAGAVADESEETESAEAELHGPGSAGGSGEEAGSQAATG